MPAAVALTHLDLLLEPRTGAAGVLQHDARTVTAHSEDRRQFIHLGMAAWLLTFRWMTPPQAAGLALAAVAVNWVILPLSGLDRRWMRRPGARFVDGVKLYPICVLIAVAFLPLHMAAATWAVLGVGDAVANLAGRRWGRPPFLGRDDRSLLGTATFVLSAWPAAFGALYWVGGGHGVTWDPATAAAAAAGAAAAGALAELAPWPKWLDDNLPITLAAGVVLYFTA